MRVGKLKENPTKQQLTQYFIDLNTAGLMYHIDDPIEDIMWGVVITDDEIEVLKANHEILWSTDFDPWECMP